MSSRPLFLLKAIVRSQTSPGCCPFEPSTCPHLPTGLHQSANGSNGTVQRNAEQCRNNSVVKSHTVIRVRPEDIYALRNSTGRPFTDHLDRLIRSSASVVGIVAAAVSDNPRTNVADGGADTEVSAPATLPDRWGYFVVPSVWQYKAVEVGSLTDKQIAEEITAPSKQYVRDLLVRGYGYRFCICRDGTAERKAEIKAVLAAEIERLNPNAPEPLILFAK